MNRDPESSTVSEQGFASEFSSDLDSFAVQIGEVDGLEGGVFVSDLHLLSSRCDSERALADLHRYDSQEHCIVLGGDTFDFRWSTSGGCEQTCEAAMRWIEELLVATGKTTVYFLLGNHDCLPEFEGRLSELSQSESRFHLVPHVLLLDDCMFLHGDVVHAGGFARLRHYRKKYHHHEPRSDWQHRCYDLAVRLRVPGLVSRTVSPTPSTCGRLSSMIEEAELPEWAAVKRVFFGHTHVVANGFTVDGRQYYNAGSGIRFMQYLPHEFTFHDFAK